MTRRTKFLLSALVTTLALQIPISAKTIWVAQTSTGSDDGSSAADAHSTSWFNTAANWGSGTTQINPGDTVMLTGTVSSPMVFQGSGTPGSSITLLFADGARMSAPHWNQGGVNYDAAISASGKSYITIDGGNDGLIEATANGTALANQLQCNGVAISGPSVGIAVRNLTVEHLYQRTAGSTDPNYICSSIRVQDRFSNVTVSNNTTSDSGSGIQIGFRPGDSGLTIFGNTCTKHGIALNIGSAESGATLENARIYSNDLSGDTTWSGYSGIHMNCLHIFAVQSSTHITNLRVYGNYFHGNMGVFPTSLAFFEGYITAPLIYDNVFYHDTFVGGNGDLTLKGADGALVLNNTFVTNAHGTAVGTTTWLGTETFTLANNIFLDYGFAVYDGTSGAHAVAAADNDLVYPTTGTNATSFKVNGIYGATFAQWQSAGFDIHGVQLSPNLDMNYIPEFGSPAIDAGTSTLPGSTTSLLSLFSTDKAGAARVEGTAMDIGAYEVSLIAPMKPLLPRTLGPDARQRTLTFPSQ